MFTIYLGEMRLKTATFMVERALGRSFAGSLLILVLRRGEKYAHRHTWAAQLAAAGQRSRECNASTGAAAGLVHVPRV